MLNKLRRLKSAILPRKKVKIEDFGHNNIVIIEGEPAGLGIRVIMRGSNNKVFIGKNCGFFGENNRVFITGNDNEVIIGSKTTFDKNVLLVAGEATSLKIGEDCMSANGVTVRTTDQHPIYSPDGQRLNQAGDVTIGDHVWTSANSVIIKHLQVGGVA